LEAAAGELPRRRSGDLETGMLVGKAARPRYERDWEMGECGLCKKQVFVY
jgi:hypothetical protein